MPGIKQTLATVTLVFTLISSGSGQLSAWEFGGYAKDLITYTDGPIAEIPLDYGKWQNSAQLRLNLFWYPGTDISANVQARTQLIYQKNIKSLNMLLGLLETDRLLF